MGDHGLSELVSREQLLRSIVKATERNDVYISGNVKVERATSAVEGFTSLVFRVKVSYRFLGNDEEEHSKVFVVKRMPQVDEQIEMVKRCRIFEREGIYFDKVAPLMRGVSGGKVDVPLPECFFAVYGGESDALYIEDLAEGGFRTPDRNYRVEGLDLAHCSLAMKRLGRLHGLAVAAEKTLPTRGGGGWLELIPEFYKDTVFYETEPDEPPNPLIGMISKGLETIVQISKELDGLPRAAEASGALDKVIQGAWSTLCRMVKPDPRGRNLLTHGDCWMNNMMFRYERDDSGAENPVDAKFIDLQVTRYCHPCIDILYFMYVCTTRSFRERHFDEVIVEYYDSMVETLKALDAGIPPLSLEDLKEDLHGKYKPFGVIIGVVFTPILRLGEDFIPSTLEEMNPEKFKEVIESGNASVIRTRFANDPDYRSIMEDCAREFVDMAIPDGLDYLVSSPLLI